MSKLRVRKRLRVRRKLRFVARGGNLAASRCFPPRPTPGSRQKTAFRKPAGVRPGKLSAKRFGVEAEVISPAHHIGPHTPPTLILHGTADTTVPYASVVAFESEMKKAGRPCKLVGYEGAEHTFFRRAEYYDKTLAEADAFLVDLGWIKK